jgi:hypothetical protein
MKNKTPIYLFSDKKIQKIKKTKHKNKEQCDKLLTPTIIKLFPRCILCNMPTQVAHHHCHKSKSLALRHDLKNLINLCHSCHLKLHWNESYWGSKVATIKGKAWFNYIERQKQITVRYPDYDKIYERLQKIIDSNNTLC